MKRWINYVQQDVCARWPWNFLRSREAITTVTDKKAGTVSVSSAGTTVTGVGTAFTAGSTWLSGGSYGDIGNFIQFSGANDWYEISAVGGTTSLTITVPYQGLTNLSGVTYTLRKIFYSLSSSCDRIMDVKSWTTPLRLDELFPGDVDEVSPNPSSGTAYGYFPYGYDPTNNVRIVPYPFPSDARIFEIKTFKRPTDMVATSDVPNLPNKWAHVIAFGATSVAYAYLRKFELSAAWDAKFEKKINDMKAQERTSEDDSSVLQSIDTGNRSENFLQMPGNYPNVGGRI